MKALIKNPGDESFREIIIPNELKLLQQLVGGPIETVTLEPDYCVVCNEEGRLRGLEHNCWYLGVEFVGTILLVGTDGEEFCDVPISVAMANAEVEA